MDDHKIEKKINPILSIVQKKRFQSASQNFIKGASPFMMQYFDSINKIVDIKGLGEKFGKLIGKQEKQLQQTKEQVQKQKKGNGYLVVLGAAGTLMIGGYLFLRSKFNQLENLIRKPLTSQEAASLDVVFRKIKQEDPTWSQRKFQLNLQNKLTPYCLEIIDMIYRGFNLLLNDSAVNLSGIPENVFAYILRKVTQQQVAQVIENNKFTGIVEMFGLQLRRSIDKRPILKNYIAYGNQVMHRMQFLSGQLAALVTGHRHRYHYGSSTKLMMGNTDWFSDVNIGRSHAMFVRGLDSNYNFGVQRDDITVEEAREIARRDGVDFERSGGMNMYYEPIDRDTWFDQNLQGEVTLFLRSAVERHAPNVFKNVTTGFLSSTVTAKMFTDEIAAIKTSFNLLIAKDSDFEILRKATYRYSYDSSTQATLQDDTVRRLYRHYNQIYKQFSSYNGISRNYELWDAVRKQHNEIYSWGEHNFTVQRLGILIFVDSFLTVYMSRIKQQNIFQDDLRDHYQGNSSDITSMKKRLMAQYGMSLQKIGAIHRLNEGLTKEYITIDQYLNQIKGYLNDLREGKGLFEWINLEVLNQFDWRDLDKYKYSFLHTHKKYALNQSVTNSTIKTMHLSTSGSLDQSLQQKNEDNHVYESYAQSSIDVITMESRKKKLLLDEYKEREKIIGYVKDHFTNVYYQMTPLQEELILYVKMMDDMYWNSQTGFKIKLKIYEGILKGVLTTKSQIDRKISSMKFTAVREVNNSYYEAGQSTVYDAGIDLDNYSYAD